MLLSESTVLSRKDLFFEKQSAIDQSIGGTDLTLTQLEHKYIQKILEEERGQVDHAAKRLGIPRSSLYQKIKRYQIKLSKPE